MNKSLKIIMTNALGTFLEYFDYALYGFSIPIIAPLFFPSDNPTNSILFAWSTILIGLLIRPFSAIILGYYGDRIGRKKILKFTVILMAASTVAFGLIPTYSQIGILAPILLLICRVVQSFSVSSEYNGSCIYLTEMFSKNKSLMASTIVFSCGLGIMVSSLLTIIFISSNGINSFGFNTWRIPFVFGGLFAGIVGLCMIDKMPESQAFLRVKNKNEILKNPFVCLLKNKKKIIFSTMILSGYSGTVTYILTIYLSIYLQTIVNIDLYHSILIVTVGSFIGTLTAPLFGYFADLKGQKYIMLWSLIVTASISIPLFLLVQTKNILLIIIMVSISCICNAAFCTPLASLLPNLFSPEMRCSGMGISFNCGAAFIGGLAPMVITILTTMMKNSIVPGIYLTIFAAMAFYILWNMSLLRIEKDQYAEPL